MRWSGRGRGLNSPCRRVGRVRRAWPQPRRRRWRYERRRPRPSLSPATVRSTTTTTTTTAAAAAPVASPCSRASHRARHHGRFRHRAEPCDHANPDSSVPRILSPIRSRTATPAKAPSSTPTPPTAPSCRCNRCPSGGSKRVPFVRTATCVRSSRGGLKGWKEAGATCDTAATAAAAAAAVTATAAGVECVVGAELAGRVGR